jgi:NAD(P)-dependent dehydrogenase (short-subunit alcohol dehydrogenase family)
VTDASSLAALAACARERLGGLDCLVNNAAIFAGLARKT